MGKTRRYRKSLGLAGLATALLIMAAAAVYVRNVQSFNHAEKAFHDNDLPLAANYYEQSIRWYLPFNKRVKMAVQRLWQIGRQAETEGNYKQAKDTYGRLRSSLRAVTSFYQPYSRWIAKCDDKLETIAGSTLHSPNKTGRPVHHNKAAKRRSIPHAGWAFAMQIAFWGWIAATVGLIMSGLGREQSPNRMNRLGWMGLTACFYAVWLFSMANA